MNNGIPNRPIAPEAKPGTIYRPVYQPPADAKHALSNVQAPPRTTIEENILGAISALEAWRNADEREQKDVRWHPAQASQLNVWLSPPPDATWTALVQRAFVEWQAASGTLIGFEWTVRPEQAHIQIKWNDTPVRGRQYEVGHTQRDVVPPHWIRQAQITLLTAPLIDQHLGERQRKDRLYTTVLHEVGHALGLEHTHSKRDVMHHRGWQNKHLSTNDIQRLHQLYRQPAPSHLF